MKQTNDHKSTILFICVCCLLLLISVTNSFGFWLAVTLLTASGLTLLYSLGIQLKNAIIKPAHRLYAKDFSLKFIATLMGIFLVWGTLLYFYVFHTIQLDPPSDNGVQFSNAEYLFRSLICSLDLFMLDVDSNILDRLDNHATLKGVLSLQAVVSFSCTVAMLIGLVYSRINAYYRLCFSTKINNNRNHLYLFFGNNEPSSLLIKDIIEQDPKAVAVIVDIANVKDDNNDEWEGIVGLIAHKQEVFKTANKIGAHVAIASQHLDDIDDDIAACVDFDAFGYLGLSRIKKFILRLRQTTNPQLHIFFMSEDEELNIRNIITLAKDKTITSVAQDKKLFHRIYCHARFNGPNRVIQDVAIKKHLNIKIVDSSHIAIELLKLDKTCHPINVVNFSKNSIATVESPLKTLIIGFGEVGRDAFRFLYEFGAFVNCKNENIRSPFECTIVDKNLDDIKGTFMASMPAIFKYDKSEKKFHNNDIQFFNLDYNSEEFYSAILLNDDFLAKVNYIVISIGNNDEAIALATRIFNQVRKVREDVSNLRIFVRCTENNKVEGIQKIADHYNFGYGDGEKNTPVIHIFGQPEKTYTFDLVVSDRLIEEGKVFHGKYRLLSGEGDSWDVRHRKLTDVATPNIEKLRKLRRQESQDRANALHAGTKIIILKETMEDLYTSVDWNGFFLRYFNIDGTTNVTGAQTNIRYPSLSVQENDIIRHLAMLEHLRWNAAHELMGYVFNDDGTSCDERTMKHNCLCEWDKLDAQSDKQTGWFCDYKKYDFCVVDTTIALNKDALISNKD